jgi:methylmalonyl-CoA mutase cobalamin-binding subunit
MEEPGSVTMTNENLSIPELLSITDVERQTGIRQGTLRVWEKRYGFPRPLRDLHGDRVYPTVQVERLQAVKRLLDQGHRPGKILSGGAPDVEHFEAPQSDLELLPAEHGHVFSLLLGYRHAELHAYFQSRLLELGLRRFVIECLAPLTTAVGLAWSRGQLPVRIEHLFTQVAASTLHEKQAAVRTSGGGRPKALLATLTGESHALGIMMAEAVMATLQMECIQLGCDTPPAEVTAAARDTAADIVALSFSSYYPCKTLERMLAAIRAGLPASTAMWVGGSGVAVPAVFAPGVERIDTLEAIEPALHRWRSAHVTSPGG